MEAMRANSDIPPQWETLPNLVRRFKTQGERPKKRHTMTAGIN
jgi:hypothetical protein